jgi:predicted acylesterase/phospholipase RssA
MEESAEEHSIINELCFAGAGNKGIVYVGCLKKLEELGVLDLKKIIGVSIGSFMALCCVIGYTADEMFDIIINKSTSDFIDITFDVYGALLKGDKYREWVAEVIGKKVSITTTMEELYKSTGIEFITISTCISSNNFNSGDNFCIPEGIVIISHKTMPDMPIITAINASMAYPYIFPPIEYKSAKLVDGGLMSNFPIDMLSPLNSLGIRIAQRDIDGNEAIKNPISYTLKLYELVNKHNIKQYDNYKYVAVDCKDYFFINFNMTIDDKITLYYRGYKAVEKFFGTHNTVTSPGV